jgi:hypothetical protein
MGEGFGVVVAVGFGDALGDGEGDGVEVGIGTKRFTLDMLIGFISGKWSVSLAFKL